MEKLQLVAVVGSLRKDSYNKQLAGLAADLIADQAELTLLDYADVPLLNQDIEFPAPEPVRRVRELIKSADGVWFFTPEYNHYFPGVLKNLIDWLSRPPAKGELQVLSGKPAVVSGITPGMSGTGIAQDHLITLLTILNMDMMFPPRVTIPNAMKLLDENGRLNKTAGAPFLEVQAKAFAEFVRKRKEINR